MTNDYEMMEALLKELQIEKSTKVQQVKQLDTEIAALSNFSDKLEYAITKQKKINDSRLAKPVVHQEGSPHKEALRQVGKSLELGESVHREEDV